MLTLVIGNKNLSSWSMRPWFVLRQANIPFEEHVFLFEEDGWREKIVAFSPSRRVPALRHARTSSPDEDVVLWDSLAICEYLAEIHPERVLWPRSTAARAHARAVSAEMHSGFGSLRSAMSMDVVGRFRRRAPSHETQADIDRVLAIWDECRRRFGATATGEDAGPFLFGRFSIADAMFAPVVWRFRSYDVPLDGPNASPLARDWYEMMLDLPAMRAWEQDAEREVRELASRPKKPTPDPKSAQHCFAVIFSSSLRAGAKTEGYDAEAQRMDELAKNEPGFLGIESVRGDDGVGITVSYWDSLEAIARWKAHAEHQKAQLRGRETYYERYEIRVCSVERGYRFSRNS